MTTNGYFLTPDVVKELFRYRVIDYQITIDGIESTHNALRKLKTKDDGTYQVILNNLKAIKSQIKSSILTLTIQTNYTKDICPTAKEVRLFHMKDQLLSRYRALYNETLTILKRVFKLNRNINCAGIIMNFLLEMAIYLYLGYKLLIGGSSRLEISRYTATQFGNLKIL